VVSLRIHEFRPAVMVFRKEMFMPSPSYLCITGWHIKGTDFMGKLQISIQNSQRVGFILINDLNHGLIACFFLAKIFDK